MVKQGFPSYANPKTYKRMVADYVELTSRKGTFNFCFSTFYKYRYIKINLDEPRTPFKFIKRSTLTSMDHLKKAFFIKH